MLAAMTVSLLAGLFMAALRTDADIIFLSCLWPPIVMGRPLYFCPVVSAIFYLLRLSFFPRLISAVTDWMSTILLDMVWP